jgi:hypothetical protein
MANLVTSTEALDDTGVWTADAIVTANTHAAPAFAGINAGMADTVNDNSSGAQLSIIGTYYDILPDTSDYIGSVFIRKDAVTDRWPEVFTQMAASTVGFVSIDTSSGAIADGSVPPAASGVIDVDATWWRLWMRIVNNGSGELVRMGVYPSRLDSLGGGTGAGFTGSVVLWGFNITKSSSVQDYEPQPFYAFVTERRFFLIR